MKSSCELCTCPTLDGFKSLGTFVSPEAVFKCKSDGSGWRFNVPELRDDVCGDLIQLEPGEICSVYLDIMLESARG